LPAFFVLHPSVRVNLNLRRQVQIFIENYGLNASVPYIISLFLNASKETTQITAEIFPNNSRNQGHNRQHRFEDQPFLVSVFSL
jgi:hypothetical protein